jgi:fatty acid desaturase
MNPAPDAIKSLSKPCLWCWLWRVILDWTLVGLVFLAAYQVNHFAGYLLAVMALGPLQHAIGVMAHDGAHKRISKNPALNDFLTIFFGLAPLIMPFKLYRDFHFGHHLHTGTEKDGELEFKRTLAPAWDLPLRKGQLLKTAIKDCLGLNLKEALKMGGALSQATVKDLLPIVLWWSAAVGALAYFGALWILPLWFIASSTSFWASFRMRMWAEHQGTAGTHRYSTKLWQKLLFLPHNIDYHYEHHLYAGVPLWNLPKARSVTDSPPIIPLDDVFDSYTRMPACPSGAVLAK